MGVRQGSVPWGCDRVQYRGGATGFSTVSFAVFRCDRFGDDGADKWTAMAVGVFR